MEGKRILYSSLSLSDFARDEEPEEKHESSDDEPTQGVKKKSRAIADEDDGGGEVVRGKPPVVLSQWHIRKLYDVFVGVFVLVGAEMLWVGIQRRTAQLL